MYTKNSTQRLKITDTYNNLPEYKQKLISEGWAFPFQEHIFPAINEDRFSVLYSDKGSRPNTPVNVIIGALILKELLNKTDEELYKAIHLDLRFEFALRLTSKERPSVSYNTFTNFRKRVREYYEETGTDLIQKEVESLSQIIADTLNIDGKKTRVDSFMVASSCRNLSRIELVYTVNYQFIKKLNELANELIPEECKCYLEDGHKNDTIYKTKNSETESKLEFLLKQTKILYETGLKADQKIRDTEEFKTLKRMLGEQTKDDDSDNIEPKENENISPDSLQNPSDPDATYRYKYGDNVGYVANVAEMFNENGSIITHYDLQPNLYSDQQFSEDLIKQLTSGNKQNQSNSLNHEDKQDDEQKDSQDFPSDLLQMITDGAYYSYSLAQKALSRGIELIPGELTGKKPDNEKLNYSENFIVDDKKGQIDSCINNEEPDYTEKNKDTYYAIFSKEACEGCPHQEECRVQKRKDFNSISFTEKSYAISLQRQKMETEEYKNLINKRAAIEGIPSVFRRKYNVDNMPIRGQVRVKFRFGFKVAAYNVKKLFKGLKKALV